MAEAYTRELRKNLAISHICTYAIVVISFLKREVYGNDSVYLR